MSDQRGICMNFDHCSIANSSKPLFINENTAFICPECGQPLQSSPAIRRQSTPLNIIIAAFALAAVAFALFRYFAPEPSAPIKQAVAVPAPVKSNVMLRFAGSNTIGSELLPALAEAYLKQQGVSAVKRIPGKNAEEISLVAADNPQPETTIEIAAHGSSTAFKALAAQQADIGMASRRINRKEQTKLALLGDMTQPTREHVLALDGIAIIVNRENPISALSRDQIAAIFAGVITDWSELQRRPGKIHLYARDDKSGTWDTFRAMVLDNLRLATSAKRYEDSTTLSAQVAQDPDGIGFIGLPFVKGNKALAVSDAETAPLIATRLTVATEDYPLSRRLFLYTPDTQTNPQVRKFTEFALSHAGQEIVKQHGFIELNVRSSSAHAATPTDAPEEYARLTAGAQRLSLNFRFMTGSHRLDNKGVRDLDRVLEFLGDTPAQHVLLFGFSDTIGDTSINLRLSQDRAHVVADELARRGIKIDVVSGYGAALPVASNLTKEGREKNRRVEIWVRKQGLKIAGTH